MRHVLFLNGSVIFCGAARTQSRCSTSVELKIRPAFIDAFKTNVAFCAEFSTAAASQPFAHVNVHPDGETTIWLKAVSLSAVQDESGAGYKILKR